MHGYGDHLKPEVCAVETGGGGGAAAAPPTRDAHRWPAPPTAEDHAQPRGRGNRPSFVEAPVGGKYRVDGELASFFTAADEKFMLRRTLSRLVEMCGE